MATSLDLESISDVQDVVSDRAQWIRAAVLGANDGLLSTSAIMMGVGAVKKDMKAMILTGVAALLGGALSMAMGEYVSVHSQYDIELSGLVEENRAKNGSFEDLEARKRVLPSPTRAAAASAVAFAVGASVPVISAAFVEDYVVRIGVLVVAVSVSLVVFGWMAAVLGRSTLRFRSAVRLLVGGWLGMGVTYGLTKLVDVASEGVTHHRH